MSTIVTRASKGSILTSVEMDANLNNLNADKIESNTAVTVVGNIVAYSTTGGRQIKVATAAEIVAAIGATAVQKATITDTVDALDLRSTSLVPGYFGRGLDVAFMANTTDGLSDGGTYHGIVSIQPYSDASGGGAYQLGFTDSNNLWIRGSSGALTSWAAWKLVLDSTNYTSYAPTKTGSGASGTWGISISGSSASCSGNAATATNAVNLTGFACNPTSGTPVDTPVNSSVTYGSSLSLFGQVDGALYSHVYSASWIHQIVGDYRTGQLAIRGKSNGVWQAWRTVLDSTNYTGYSPSLTGVGASGTWGISISGSSASCSGNAATATNAANVTGTIASAVTATTQTAGDSSTKVATTAFVTTAIAASAGGFSNIQVFTTSGTFTVPAGITKVKVTVVGGGGGGAAGSGPACGALYYAGSGGGGGGTSIKIIGGLTPSSTVTVTVATAAAAGAAGTASSFGAHCSATGGAAGTQNFGAGASGGVGSGGDLNLTGGGSGPGGGLAPYYSLHAGAGGSSFMGGGAKGVSNVAVGETATGYGGGGGGGSGATGGGGAAGVVIVEW